MKIVMIVNTDLPAGLAANTAAVLGIRLGHDNHRIIGPDCRDRSQYVHKGITTESIPILGADGSHLKSIYAESIYDNRIDVIDFNRIAQGCKRYSEYAGKLSQTDSKDIEFSGLCLSGPRKAIEKLTGSLGLYR